MTETEAVDMMAAAIDASNRRARCRAKGPEGNPPNVSERGRGEAEGKLKRSFSYPLLRLRFELP